MRPSLLFIALLAMAMATLTGCASTGPGTARVLEKGESSVGVGADLLIAAPELNDAQRTRIPWFQFTASYKRGLGSPLLDRRVEAGARLWGMGIPGFFTAGAALDGKWGLLQRPKMERGWEIALAPSTGYHQINLGGAATHTFLGTLSVPFGYNFGVSHGDQFIIAPRIDVQSARSNTQNTIRYAFGGASISYAWHPFENFAILPQFVLLYSPIRFNGTLDDPERRGYVFSQYGMGFFYSF